MKPHEHAGLNQHTVFHHPNPNRTQKYDCITEAATPMQQHLCTVVGGARYGHSRRPAPGLVASALSTGAAHNRASDPRVSPPLVAMRRARATSGTGTSWGHGPETMNVLCQRLNSYRPNFSDTLVVVRG